MTSRIMADGTVCHTGPSCKRHGTGLNGFVQQVEAQLAVVRNVERVGRDETLKEVELLAEKHDFDAVTDLGDGKFRLTKELTNRWSGGPSGFRRWRAWYREGGQNVVYVEFSRQSFEGATKESLGLGEDEPLPDSEWTVCDIEVREEARGRGLALKAVRQLESDPLLEGHILHTSGGFTPEGFHALAVHLPLNRWDGEREKGIKYRSMGFVHDWDGFETNH